MLPASRFGKISTLAAPLRSENGQSSRSAGDQRDIGLHLAVDHRARAAGA